MLLSPLGERLGEGAARRHQAPTQSRSRSLPGSERHGSPRNAGHASLRAPSRRCGARLLRLEKHDGRRLSRSRAFAYLVALVVNAVLLMLIAIVEWRTRTAPACLSLAGLPHVSSGRADHSRSSVRACTWQGHLNSRTSMASALKCCCLTDG